jgi:superfamily II DNA/RNA helicase
MIDTLRSILVPGGRARISPYVQDAQAYVLFDEVPNPQDRHGDMRGILERHDGSIRKIAESYTQFAASRKQFVQETYKDEEFLRLYLAYYFTTNISKVQFCLLDLVTADKFSSTIRVVDIGVGSGTTAVAFLDFLLAWATTCHFVGRQFPVESLRFECYDLSPVCLEIAKRVVNAFCDSVSRRKELVYEQKSMAEIAERIISWGRSIEWKKLDIAKSAIEHQSDSQVLLFASNILNELSEGGRSSLATSVENMPNASIATVIEPGDKQSCVDLNSWKVSILAKSPNVHSLLPCYEYDHGDTSPCCSCWNFRRESLHEPQLYRRIREYTGDTRCFDDYSNNLLSWSYTCLEQSPLSLAAPVHESCKGILTRTLGIYRSRTIGEEVEAEAWPAKPDTPQTEMKLEYLKLCPSSYPGAEALWAKRDSGFILPPIRYGSRVGIMGAEVVRANKKPGVFLVPLTPSVEVTTLEEAPSPMGFLTEYSEKSREAVDEIAFRLFGFKTMHSFQHEILERVLTGRSMLGIAATGGGKSECYILPSMLFPGITIVISPLKSLMQDQFEKRIDERYGLRDLTTYINGDVSFPERQARLKRMELGCYRLVYLTPEQIRQSHVLSSLKRANEEVGIRYLALDEAHCISQWGHDFRDSYLNLVTRLSAFGINPIKIALTATASPEVRADLCEELQLTNAPLDLGGDVYVHSSNRAELNLIVKHARSTREKTADIISRLETFLFENADNSNPGAAIVFMPHTGRDPDSPKWNFSGAGNTSSSGQFSTTVTDFAAYLELSLGTRVAIYHGKMLDRDSVDVGRGGKKQLGDLSGRSRRSEQTAFIDGQCAIMVATKGFGMGIDKSNIRLIIHRTPPSNLEAYAQEAGRAGRDGQISDVVLYYSPPPSDDPFATNPSDYEIQGFFPTQEHIQRKDSDYDIQDFFLTQKYIRRNDVIAMNAFLKSVKRNVSGHLYFTSDEVLPFFDHLAGDIDNPNIEFDGYGEGDEYEYEWPNFPERLKRSNESVEHCAILDRGHYYMEKIRHIDRILSALYRIRPKLGSIKSTCLLESVQEAGAVLEPRGSHQVVLNAKAIIDSNLYFGKLLRDRDVTPEKFSALIDKCISEDTIELACALNLSAGDTASILWDINRADGRLVKGQWRSSLLEFLFIASPRYGVAAGFESDSEWREYAGAARRASKPFAQERALRARSNGKERRTDTKGQIVPAVDDWFGLKELTKPKGWEVRPGNAFTDDDLFEKYVDAFMDIHDRRQVNDRAAYNLLLTDYVGVKENGSLSETGDEKSCLRAVLLGYLKTGEVVLGNCLSCSRCVPSGGYERDSEKRSKVVELLGVEILDLLDALEKFDSEFPEANQLQVLWSHVKTQEASGRSLRAYIEGWSGRVLTDSPGHKTALWIRIDGMLRGVLTLQPQECCSRGLELLEATTPGELEAMWNTILFFETSMPDVPEAIFVRATACQRRNFFEESRNLWLVLLQKKEISEELRHKAHSTLCDLLDSDGPIPDSEAFPQHAIQAARTASEFTAVETFYRRAHATWVWSDIRTEIFYHSERAGHDGFAPRLMAWWVGSQSEVSRLAESPLPEDWVNITEEVLSNISEETLGSSFVAMMLTEAIEKWSASVLQQSPNLHIVRALRIVLIAEGWTENSTGLGAECLTFFEHADDESVNWLAGRIEPDGFDSTHYAVQLVLAEVALRHGDPLAADAHWRGYIDNPPAGASKEVIIYVLSRLADLHSPQAQLPDQGILDAALLAWANRAYSWEEALPIYREIIPHWSASRLQEESKGLAQKHDFKWALRLMELWAIAHDQAEDFDIVLSMLAEIPEAELEANDATVSVILDHALLRAVAAHPVFGINRLNAVLQSVKALKDSRHHLASSMDGVGSQTQSQKGTNLLPEKDVEFLVCTLLSGLLDSDKAIALGLGDMLFVSVDDEFAARMAAEYASTFREQVASGSENVFYHVYQPDTFKALDRWLFWFGPLIVGGQGNPEIIAKITDNFLKNALEAGHEYVERYLAMCVSHDIQDWVPNIAALRIFIDVVTKIEDTIDTSTADECRDLLLTLLQKEVSEELRHKVHSTLCELFDSDGPIPDLEAFSQHAIEAARTASKFKNVDIFYRSAHPKWAWGDIRPEILYHYERAGDDGFAPRLMAWWVGSQSGINRLAESPPPEDWVNITEEVLSHISEEAPGSSFVAKMLTEAIEKWSASVLQQSPNLHLVRALRIVLVAEGWTENSTGLGTECLAFFDHVDEESVDWLAGHIEAGRSDSADMTQVVSAEVAYRHGELLTADALWRKYIDNLPVDASEEVVLHVLSRLTLHRPDTQSTDQVSLDAKLLNWANVCIKHDIHDWISNMAVLRVFVDVVKKIETASDISIAPNLDRTHFSSLQYAVDAPSDVLRADVLVSLLKSIRSRTNIHWLTPLSHLVEALVVAGRVDEVSDVNDAPDLTVGRKRIPVDLLIDKWKGNKRETPNYDVFLTTLSDILIDTWKFT